MPSPPILDQSVLPVFASVPPQTIVAEDWSLSDLAAARAVVAQYAGAGFAIVQGPPDPGREQLRALARALKLGKAFIPPLYRSSVHTGEDGVSAITASTASPHPFQSRGGQNLHCDGTLQCLGQIPTTVMLCVRPGASGGASVLFNAPAAFLELHANDSDAAEQLTHPGALVRASTLVAGHATTGPAFRWDGDRLITRYSVTDTDTYHPRCANDTDALERALRFLRHAARPGSPHRCEFTLRAGQALLLANDRVCHGRTAYRDTPGGERLLLRSLFTRRPHLTAAAEDGSP